MKKAIKKAKEKIQKSFRGIEYVNVPLLLELT